MLIKHLIKLLLAHNPDAHALFMTQRKQPFENHIAGVAARSQMPDQEGRIEDGIAQNDVFLVVGKRIRPGSQSAWLVAEQADEEEVAPQPPRAKHPGRDAVLKAIAWRYLDIESMEPSGSFEDDIQHLKLKDLHAALLAAYRAGIPEGLRHLQLPSPRPTLMLAETALFLDRAHQAKDWHMVSTAIAALRQGLDTDSSAALEIRRYYEREPLTIGNT